MADLHRPNGERDYWNDLEALAGSARRERVRHLEAAEKKPDDDENEDTGAGSSKRRGGEATSTASYYLQAITYALDP